MLVLVVYTGSVIKLIKQVFERRTNEILAFCRHEEKLGGNG